ncbi:uncharacterized protein LOC144747011 isoform X2 [Ciona intestinalis]
MSSVSSFYNLVTDSSVSSPSDGEVESVHADSFVLERYLNLLYIECDCSDSVLPFVPVSTLHKFYFHYRDLEEEDFNEVLSEDSEVLSEDNENFLNCTQNNVHLLGRECDRKKQMLRDVVKNFTTSIERIFSDQPSCSGTSSNATSSPLSTKSSTPLSTKSSTILKTGKISKSGRRQRKCPYCTKMFYNVTTHYNNHHKDLPKSKLL